MTWIATAIVGGALIGGYASNKAAKTQAQAAQQGIEAQEQGLQQQIAFGEKSLASQERALEQQLAFGEKGLASQERMYQQGIELQKPFREAGINALNKLIPLSDYTKFGAKQFQEDLGYAFRLSEGMKALDRTAAARGGLLSGGTLKAAQRYGQDMGSQEYMNAFNRYQTERNAQINPLQSLVGAGQTSTNQLSNSASAMGQNYAAGYNQMGQNYANMGQNYAAGYNQMGQNYANMGQNYAAGYNNIGQARASGYVGTANALTSALGTGMNYSQNQQYINRLPYGGGGQGYTYIEMPR
jgi:hypothetical protein